jgi:hypothetical protein
MLVEIPDGLQSLHFHTLTLSPTRVNWVEKWSNTQIISFMGPMMWISSAKDGKTQLGARMMVFKKAQYWAKVYKGLLTGLSCLVLEDDSIMTTPSTCHPC